MCWRRGWTTYSGNIKITIAICFRFFSQNIHILLLQTLLFNFYFANYFRSSPIKYFTTELSLKGRLKRLLLRKPSTSTFLFLSIKTRLIDWFYFCHFYIMFSKTLTFTSFFYEGGMTLSEIWNYVPFLFILLFFDE